MRTSRAPQVSETKRRILAAIGVDLDAPYFAVTEEYMAGNRCKHVEFGVELDKVDRVARCQKCHVTIDPFEALLNYAKAERRLVNTLSQIRQAEESERRSKEREQERKPFARRVVGRVDRKDLAQKTEPVIGQTLTLECGHSKEVGVDNRFKRVTCVECKDAAKQLARAAKNAAKQIAAPKAAK